MSYLDDVLKQTAQFKSGVGASTDLLGTLLKASSAGGGGQGGSLGGAGGAPGGVKSSGNLDNWIDQALKLTGLDPAKYHAGVKRMVMQESSGNPNATNHTDSNAKAGHPSTGLMQTIPSTFAAYALPGYNTNINDPISNLIAGIRYAQSRYGTGMLAAGGRKNSAGKYIGY